MIIGKKWASINEQTIILYKERRKTTLNDRIISINKVWVDYNFINSCAKTVYMNNYAIYHVFVL